GTRSGASRACQGERPPGRPPDPPVTDGPRRLPRCCGQRLTAAGRRTQAKPEPITVSDVECDRPHSRIADLARPTEIRGIMKVPRRSSCSVRDGSAIRGWIAASPPGRRGSSELSISDGRPRRRYYQLTKDGAEQARMALAEISFRREKRRSGLGSPQPGPLG